MMKNRRHAARGGLIPEIDLEEGMPRVQEALGAMERGLARARVEKIAVVKFIHGYGSSGVGGEIRIAVQKRLREMESAGAIRACIYGEDWGTSDAKTWALLKGRPELKGDAHLGRKNLGITVVVV
jgi:DNA-nicking Smr family endonuclease